MRLASGTAVLLGFLAAGCSSDASAPARSSAGDEAVAIFATGCFWCTEADFETVPGVIDVVSGYTGGTVENPTYREVGTGRTGHVEAVEVRFDPATVTYAELLDRFWRTTDPLDDGGQFCDRGSEYRSAIFYRDEEQHRLAEESRAAIEASGRFREPIATRIEPAGRFYPAEDYHQDYARLNTLTYHFYRTGCGRDRRLEALWGE